MLAGQLADTSKAEEGIKLAKAQLKGNPGDREVHLALAQMYTRMRRWKEAADEIDAADALSTSTNAGRTRSTSTFCAGRWMSGRSTTIPPKSSSARSWPSTATTA